MEPYNQRVEVAISILNNANSETSRKLIQLAEQTLIDYLSKDK